MCHKLSDMFLKENEKKQQNTHTPPRDFPSKQKIKPI